MDGKSWTVSQVFQRNMGREKKPVLWGQILSPVFARREQNNMVVIDLDLEPNCKIRDHHVIPGDRNGLVGTACAFLPNIAT